MRQLKWTTRVAAFIGGLLMTTAAAFFFATFVSDGSGEGQTGKGTITQMPNNVEFEDGLSPSKPVPLSVKVENTTGATREFSKVQFTIETPTVPICGQQWLEIKPTSGFTGFWEETFAGTNNEKVKVQTGTHDIFTEGGWPATVVQLRFKPSLVAFTNQTSCEDTNVIVKAHLE